MNIQLIAGYLQLLRKNKGLTQEDLANELGVSRQAVSKWETGSGLPDMEILLQLSDCFTQIDFEEERRRIGRIRITEVEEAQNEILSLINLLITI